MQDYFSAISAIVAIVVFAFSAKQYLDVRRRELDDTELKQYHSVVRQLLVDDKARDGSPFIDVQIAGVYQLALMPSRYSESSKIILLRIKDRSQAPHFKDLGLAADAAINQLEKRQKYGKNVTGKRLLTVDFAVAIGLGTGCVIAALQAAEKYFQIPSAWMLGGTLFLTGASLLLAHWFALRLEK